MSVKNVFLVEKPARSQVNYKISHRAVIIAFISIYILVPWLHAVPIQVRAYELFWVMTHLHSAPNYL